MLSTTTSPLLSLPPEIILRIFRHLLVPGCIEQRLKAPTFTPGQRERAVTETFLTYPDDAEAGGPERARLHPMFYRKLLKRRQANFHPQYRGSEYLWYQRLHYCRLPGTGGHSVTVLDLNKRALPKRAIELAKANAICLCGHCQWRRSLRLVSRYQERNISKRDKKKRDKGTEFFEKFFGNLLICKGIYMIIRELIFAENIFAFPKPQDMSRFLARLQPWQKRLVRKVEILEAAVVVLFEPGNRDQLEEVSRVMRTKVRAVSNQIHMVMDGEFEERVSRLSLP